MVKKPVRKNLRRFSFFPSSKHSFFFVLFSLCRYFFYNFGVFAECISSPCHSQQFLQFPTFVFFVLSINFSLFLPLTVYIYHWFSRFGSIRGHQICIRPPGKLDLFSIKTRRNKKKSKKLGKVVPSHFNRFEASWFLSEATIVFW